MFEAIKQVYDNFRSRPSPQPPFSGLIDSEGGVNAGRGFTPEASYFTIRMVEMRLAEGGKYFVDFLPLGVCVADYKYGSERRRVPLILSNEAVQQMLGSSGAKAGFVDFRNMPVVVRAPVKAGDISLFVGLFRMPYSDIARSVLQLVSDVSSEVGGAALKTGVAAASKVYDRVAQMFKLKDVEPRFAYLDGQALTKSGYLLVSGSLTEDVRKTDLVVKNGRLRLKGDTEDAPPYDFDYCLLSIEQQDSLFSGGAGAAALNDLADLPFHKKWNEVGQLLVKRKSAEAEEALMVLRSEVLASPDLTEDDRLIAIAGYDVAYARYEQQFQARTEVAKGPAMRAPRVRTQATGLRELAAASAKNNDPATAKALENIAFQLLRPLKDTSRGADDILAEAIGELRNDIADAANGGVRAATLANMLSVGAARMKNS